MAYRPEYRALAEEELVRLFQAGAGEDARATAGADARSTRSTKDAAFTEIVERYQKRIYFAARKMVHGDHDEADEIAQETFVKAYEALNTFRGEAKLYTWLYRIMMNAAIQRSRKAKSRPMVDLESIQELAEEGVAPEDQLLKSETTRLIEQAIETLPPKQQRVFMMRFYEELPYEDIATIVGTSVGGLKANYFHAVQKIGDYLHAQERISANDGSELPIFTKEY
ncbi:MAG TPA: sigma-70 family RNA polymerase sigma factor [Candidatus Kapabacteria bacterium]|nr:sigma-70 family RNA polymerase sigma factor [Candidatus Kapabacteria bacterium]